MSWPPTSHTVNEMFLYSTVSTLKPTVGIVDTLLWSLSLYRIAVCERSHLLVFPELSSPSTRIRSSRLPNSLPFSRENKAPIDAPSTSRAPSNTYHVITMAPAPLTLHQRCCVAKLGAGEVLFVFQPAEEGGAGAAAMIKDGLMDRFGVQQVYGMHNGPGIPIGSFAIRSGPIMASTDEVNINIEGLGGHAARPHKCIDSVMVGAQLITALQSIVSRSVDPLDSAVISICEFHAGHARNVIPQTAVLRGTVRTLTPEVRQLIEKRIGEVVKGVAQLTGARIDLDYKRGYPVTVNHASQTEFATRIAKEVAGDGNVHTMPPLMGGEDFSYMLEARPGAFIFCGNGDSAGLHHPAYNFNDEAIVYGTSYFVKIVEDALAA